MAFSKFPANIIFCIKTCREIRKNVSKNFLCTREYSKQPTLTKDRYTHVKRGNFNKVTPEHLQFFRSILGTRMLTDESDVEGYNVDWLRIVRGFGGVVLRPKTTEEVSILIKYCNENRLAVCPQGGNTGLVGGSVPVFDEIILSFSLMNDVISLDPISGVITCQAGCILSQLDLLLRQNNLIMPLDLGAKDSCQIGGNLSTNAGGLRLLKYGSLHGSVLGMEVVLADGTVLDLLSALKKDNTGFHLKHLFIGSEGTLGVITKAIIKCPPLPTAISVIFLGLNSFDDVLKTFQIARSELGDIISSCELIDQSSLEFSLNFLKRNSPFPSNYNFYMLLETSGSNVEHDQAKVEQFLQIAMSKELIQDGFMTTEDLKVQKIWQIRETIPTAIMVDAYVFKYDISLPLTKFYEPVLVMKDRLKEFPGVFVTGYGHVGDGNLHLNVIAKKYDKALADQIEPFVFEWTHKLRGSISAEHGIGFKKTQYLHFSKTKESIDVMRNLKKLFDPNGILNPYKVLPLPSES